MSVITAPGIDFGDLMVFPTNEMLHRTWNGVLLGLPMPECQKIFGLPRMDGG